MAAAAHRPVDADREPLRELCHVYGPPVTVPTAYQKRFRLSSSSTARDFGHLAAPDPGRTEHRGHDPAPRVARILRRRVVDEAVDHALVFRLEPAPLERARRDPEERG